MTLRKPALFAPLLLQLLLAGAASAQGVKIAAVLPEANATNVPTNAGIFLKLYCCAPQPNQSTLFRVLVNGNPIIGSDSGLSFRKITGDISVYRPVTSAITFAARLRGGFVTGSSTAAPPQERLFAGGFNSDRGFGENELGPLVYLIDQSNIDIDSATFGDTANVLNARPQATAARVIPVGGNALVVINSELRIRDPFFPELLEYIPFVDAGQLWTRELATNRINVDRLVVTPGLGLRYFSPVGPIQANAGYNPSKTRAGPAYWAAIDNPLTSNSPLLCVTPAGSKPVLIPKDRDGRMIASTQDCPADFVPFRSSNFFKRFVYTVSAEGASQPSDALFSLPATQGAATVPFTMSAPATGKQAVPLETASGSVVLRNPGDAAVKVPAGTRIANHADIGYTTQSEVEVPAAGGDGPAVGAGPRSNTASEKPSVFLLRDHLLSHRSFLESVTSASRGPRHTTFRCKAACSARVTGVDGRRRTRGRGGGPDSGASGRPGRGAQCSRGAGTT